MDQSNQQQCPPPRPMTVDIYVGESCIRSIDGYNFVFYILSDLSFVYKTVDFEPLHMKTKNSDSDQV